MEYTAEHFMKALAIAIGVHGTQKRRDGQAYMTHVLIVAMSQSTTFGQICGLLHDVLEDCEEGTSPYWRSRIQNELGDDVIRTVLSLTKAKGEVYADYIYQLSHNPNAIPIKLCDLEHNMSDGGDIPPKKYVEAHCFLTQVGYY